MKHTPRLMTTLVVLAALAGPAALAADTAGVRAKIQSDYARMDTALARKELVGAFAFYDPAYVHVTETGHAETLADTRRQVTAILAHVTSLKSKTHVDRLSVQGSTATATITQRIVITGANPRTGKTSTLTSTDVDREVWIARGGQWRLKSGRTLSSRSTVDGKPYNGH